MSKRTRVSYNATEDMYMMVARQSQLYQASASILITTLYREDDTQCSTPPTVAVKLVQFNFRHVAKRMTDPSLKGRHRDEIQLSRRLVRGRALQAPRRSRGDSENEQITDADESPHHGNKG